MPTSSPFQVEHICRLVWVSAPERVLDVGIGRGFYASAIRNFVYPDMYIAGVEVEPRYLNRFSGCMYDSVVVADVLDLTAPYLAGFDCVLMVDVLEHLTKIDGLALLSRFPGWIVISTPRDFFEQPYDMYPSEEHKSHWTPADFEQMNRKSDVVVTEYGALIVRVHPQYDVTDLAAWWEKEAAEGRARERISPASPDNYDSAGKDACDRFLDALKEYIPAESWGAMTLTEFGAGEGRVTQHLSPLFRKIVAVDIAPTMLKLLQERGLPNIVPYLSDGTGWLPVVDMAYSDSVFLHVPKDLVRTICHTIRQSLQIDSYFLFQLPVYTEGRKEPSGPIDIGIWSPYEIENLATVSGFEVVSMAVNEGRFSHDDIGSEHANFHVLRAK